MSKYPYRKWLFISSFSFIIPAIKQFITKNYVTSIYQTGIIYNSLRYHYYGCHSTRYIDILWNLIGGSGYMLTSIITHQYIPVISAGFAFAIFALGINHGRPQYIHILGIHIPCWISFWYFTEKYDL